MFRVRFLALQYEKQFCLSLCLLIHFFFLCICTSVPLFSISFFPVLFIFLSFVHSSVVPFLRLFLSRIHTLSHARTRAHSHTRTHSFPQYQLNERKAMYHSEFLTHTIIAIILNVYDNTLTDWTGIHQGLLFWVQFNKKKLRPKIVNLRRLAPWSNG